MSTMNTWLPLPEAERARCERVYRATVKQNFVRLVEAEVRDWNAITQVGNIMLAQNPLPKEIFRGPYDESWGFQDGGQIGRTFAGKEIQSLETGSPASPGS